ncbi:PREDICTED: HHIP-like protein 2 [Branchiostoma belcheri]|uniref:HHIP-like protein 2 n=1 Tax=Branchiostoma belcheri TaxID=7741 RepID=A0A6P4Y9U9_BRABE|nr:PREDICTED: HHIP-like protein 2 [Branchiostoma belcheri]
MSSKVRLSPCTSGISWALFVILAVSHLSRGAENCPVSTERLVQNQYPGCVCLQEFVGGLRSPVAMLQPDDGTGRFFIVEQIGVVRVADKYGRLRREPLLDLTRRVLTSDAAGDERGLLGMALHPRYKDNGYLYVYYTTEQGGTRRTVVSRLNVSDDENLKEQADPRYEKVLLEIEQPGNRNNGGQLLFGLDGFLYIFVGDGGGAGDTAGDRSSLLGKVLRIDVDGAGPERPYGIPTDNPFVSEVLWPDARREVFAFGLRNPWRCSLDPGVDEGAGTGRIFCGDVGESGYEEISIISKGRNHGWPDREGYTCQNTGNCAGDDVLPIDVYGRTEGRRAAVIGGVMYRGCGVPDVRGLYLYADYLGLMNKELFYLDEQPNGSWMNGTVCVLNNRECVTNLQPSVKTEDHFILGFGQDFSGEVYLLTTTSPVVSQRTGRIFKLVDPRSTACPVCGLSLAFLLSLAALVITMSSAV